PTVHRVLAERAVLDVAGLLGLVAHQLADVGDPLPRLDRDRRCFLHRLRLGVQLALAVAGPGDHLHLLRGEVAAVLLCRFDDAVDEVLFVRDLSRDAAEHLVCGSHFGGPFDASNTGTFLSLERRFPRNSRPTQWSTTAGSSANSPEHTPTRRRRTKSGRATGSRRRRNRRPDRRPRRRCRPGTRRAWKCSGLTAP